MKSIVAVVGLALFFCVLASRAADNIQAFPPAGEGMIRYVLTLPQQEDESEFQVELIVGKTVEVDAVNRYFFGGKIAEETIKGWGFPKFVVSKLGPLAGTLMAADPDEPKVERFISLGGERFITRYNSRLPIVLYVPEGVEGRYRIWRADAETTAMEEG